MQGPGGDLEAAPASSSAMGPPSSDVSETPSPGSGQATKVAPGRFGDRPSRWQVVLVAVGIAAAATLTYGAFAGWYQGSSTATITGSLTFDQARNAADGAAASYGSGGWGVAFAAGLVPSVSTAAPTSEITGSNALCQYTAVGSETLPTSFAVPASQGSPNSGRSAFWEFIFSDSSHDLLLVLVIEGEADAIAYYTPASCPSNTAEFSGLTPVPPDVVDSPTVAAAVQADGGSTFMAAWTPSTVELVLLGSNASYSSSPAWAAEYSTCAPFPSSGNAPSGSQWDETWFVGGLNGTVFSSTGPVQTSCAAGPGQQPYTVGFGVGNPSENGTTYFDEIPISVTQGLQTTMFGFSMTASTGTPASAGANPSLQASGCSNTQPGDPSGLSFDECTAAAGQSWYIALCPQNGQSILAIFDSSGWHLPAGVTAVTLTNADEIVVVSGSLLAGSADTLSVFGIGSASVSGSTVL